VAVTPDGQRAISGSSDGTLKVWDLAAGRLEGTLEGHGSGVWAVAVTPDGQRAISGSSDGTLKVWDLAAGQLKAILEGHVSGVLGVAVTPDGQRAISGSHDCTLKVWDLAGGGLILTLNGHRDSVRAVAVTPDGRRAISGSADGTLKLWDLASVQCLASFHADAAVMAVSAAQDGVLVAGDASGAVHILQCLSAVATVEACRALDAIEQKIRQQVSTYRGYVIADRRSGAVSLVEQSLPRQLRFMIAFNIKDGLKTIGVATFVGCVIHDILSLQNYRITSVKFQSKSDGYPIQVEYSFCDTEEFNVNLILTA
jgi:WD40 repeat protein